MSTERVLCPGDNVHTVYRSIYGPEFDPARQTRSMARVQAMLLEGCIVKVMVVVEEDGEMVLHVSKKLEEDYMDFD